MTDDASSTLSIEERKAVFAALVEAMNCALDLAQARDAVAERFGISGQEVRRIEDEGIEAAWPPLG